jgi:hypothetical protein
MRSDDLAAGVRKVLAPDAVPYSSAGMRRLGINPPPSPATLARWRLRGLANVRPVTFLRGGRRYILPADLAAFFAAVTAARDGAPVVLDADRDDADDRELDSAGI